MSQVHFRLVSSLVSMMEITVGHLSLIVIDANNRCWKPCHLCVTLAVVTIPEIVIWLMVAVMVRVVMWSFGVHLVDGDGSYG